MKRIILLLVSLAIGNNIYAQTDTTALTQNTVDTLSMSKWSQTDSLKIGLLDRIRQHTAPSYKLYATDNMWTFLELETFTGKIWQVQYSIKGPDYRFKAVINDVSLVPYFDEEGAYAGRFELFKTQNMYNFLLLDTSNGRTWQVQWSMESKDRVILRIY